jgi:hypothetical protein
VITTSSVEEGQTPLVTVHLKVVVPTGRLVTPDVGEAGVVTTAVLPPSTDHAPEPTAGVFPASVVVVAHTALSPPAAAVVGTASLVMTTSSLEAGQVPFVIVHLKVVVPIGRFVTPEVGEEGVLTTATLPPSTDHAPEPTAGVLPDKVVVLAQTALSPPAAAVVGKACTTMVTSPILGGHVAFPTVHLITVVPTPILFTVVVLLLAFVKVTVWGPLTKVHVPV